MDCSTPGLPVHRQFPEFTQTQVHWVGDAIQPSHPLSSLSSHLQSFPALRSFPMSQFVTSGGQSIGVSVSPSVISMNIQDWFPLGWTGWISLQSKGLSRVCSSTTVQSINSSALSFLDSPTLYDPMDCSMPGLPVHCQFLEFTQTHVHWVGDAIQPSHLLSSPSPPAFNLSQHHSLFHWVSSLHQVAKLLEFSFNISSSNEYSGLISFRMHWLDLLAVQGTLKSLLQHHSSKASILWHSAVFIGQLSHPYMTPGKP